MSKGVITSLGQVSRCRRTLIRQGGDAPPTPRLSSLARWRPSASHHPGTQSLMLDNDTEYEGEPSVAGTYHLDVIGECWTGFGLESPECLWLEFALR